jgi:hypothetical protein
MVCAALLAWAGPSGADSYRADEFLGLDLSKAVLSQKPLGPETHFAPVPVEAASDHDAAAPAPVEPKPVAHVVIPKVRTETRVSTRTSSRVAAGAPHARGTRTHGLARPRLARHRGNPLDAQAFDTRIQVWPCRSGGICNWQRQPN